MRREAGFSLIEVAIVLAIMGLVLGASLTVMRTQMTNRAIDETQGRLQVIEDALRAFVARHNRLPCPAVRELAETDGNYGREAASAGVCTDTVEVPADEAVPADRTDRLGVLPVRDLGLYGEQALDGWYRQYTYQVVASATSKDSLSSSAWAGDVILLDAAGGAPLLTEGVVAILSHGANGAGAFQRNGQQLPAPAQVTAADEAENADSDLEFVLADYSDLEANPYDDLVRVLTEDQIIQPLAAQGVVKSKAAQANERLERAARALLSFAVNDESDPDGPPSPAGCTCGAGCTSGCARSVRRRLPYAESAVSPDGHETFGTTSGLIPYADLGLTGEDVTDPWGTALRYEPNWRVARRGDGDDDYIGIYSGADASNPAYTVISAGPDRDFDTTNDNKTISPSVTELVGALVTASVRVD